MYQYSRGMLRVPKSSSCPDLCHLDGSGHPPSSPRLSGTVKHRSQQELFSGSLPNSRSLQKPCRRAVSGPLRAGFIDWPLAHASMPDVIHEAADAERDLIQDAVWAKVRQSRRPCMQCCPPPANFCRATHAESSAKVLGHFCLQSMQPPLTCHQPASGPPASAVMPVLLSTPRCLCQAPWL